MAIPKKGITTYKRDKNKVEISGEPENVKWPILYDQLNNTLLWLVPVIILLIVLPKASLIPLILKWVKKSTFLNLFTVLVGFAQLFLSG